MKRRWSSLTRPNSLFIHDSITNPHFQRDLIAYLLLVLFTMVGVEYGNSLQEEFTNLRVWTYRNVGLLLLGIPFLAFQPWASIGQNWPSWNIKQISLFFPLGIGLVFGLLDWIILERLLTHQPPTALPPYTQPFPYSLFLYGSGAFEIEVFYRLIPLTIGGLLLLRYKKGAYVMPGFWVLATLTALREPLEQWPTGPNWLAIYSLTTGFAMNFLQAIALQRIGFWGSLFIRLGHYLIWHIANGIMIELALQANGN